MPSLDLLTKLGIDEKLAQVYLSSLSLGIASVQAIARKAGFKRPTTYLYIEQLVKDGLLEKVPTGKKDYYRASDPGLLEKRAEQQLVNIKRALPELTEMQNVMAGKPNVVILEGKRGLERVYEEITESNAIRFWTDLSTFEVQFSDMFKRIAEAIRDKEIRCREIIADRPDVKVSSKRYAVTAGKTYTSRVATKEGIQNDSAIYGDTVALFRIQQQNLFVVLIKEPSIASTMKALFDMAWETATPFIGR